MAIISADRFKEPLIKSGFVKGTASAVPQIVYLHCGFSR